MKLMIIAKEKYFRQALAVNFPDYDIVLSGHEEALENFLLEEPTHVFIFEYEEARNDYSPALTTYNDLKNSAGDNIVFIRSGFSNYNYPDYIKAPFKTTELKKI